VFNWARPRDLSHYEKFEHYHATFYRHVEALSVTPFSPGALQRGLAALLVACIRLRGTEFNANEQAVLLATEAGHAYVTEAIDAIVARAGMVGKNKEVANLVQAELRRKVDLWRKQAQRREGGRTLGYRAGSDGVTVTCCTRRG